MLTDAQIKLILQEIRLAVKIGIETYKDAVNEGMDDIIESEEMQEYFDNVVDALYSNLDDEIWLEDAEQTRLQSMDIDLLKPLENEFRTEFGNICDRIDALDSDTFYNAIVDLAEAFSIRAEKEYGVAEDIAYAVFSEQTIWDSEEEDDEEDSE